MRRLRLGAGGRKVKAIVSKPTRLASLLILSALALGPLFARAEFSRPRGIFALDSRVGTYRDANIRDYPFVAGYAWRTSWETLETSEGVYDFSSIDHIIARLQPIGKKLSIQITGEPPYILAKPGVTTYAYTDKFGQLKTRAVPWDSTLRARYRTFTRALGDHGVPNAEAGGSLTPLRDHPVLYRLLVGVGIGTGWIREEGFELSSFPGYTRSKFIDAIKEGLHGVSDEFPNRFISLGFWRVTDNTVSPELWEELRTGLLTEFDGITNPRVGFFMENLAASKDSVTGTVTGNPNTTFAAPLVLSKDATHVTFQALQGWNQPFSDPSKTANAVPADGLRYANDTFGCMYFELYVADLDDQGYWPSFQEWSDLLVSVSVEMDGTRRAPSPLLARPNPANGFVHLTLPGTGEAVVHIFDFSGRRVARLRGRGVLTWNTHDYPPGLYLARIAGEPGRVVRFTVLR